MSSSAATVKAKRVRPPPATRADAIARARSLLPRIAARADMADSDRQIPAETMRDLLEAGLFDLTRPGRFGGADLGLAAMVEVATELATACGSTGWVYGVLAGHNTMASLFPDQAQTEIFGPGASLISSVFRLYGAAEPVAGGFRVSGTGRFCSGVDYAQWIIVGVDAVDGQDGRFYLVPADAVEIVDDWFTAGMRGTGSRSIRIRDAFVPVHRTVLAADLQAGRAPVAGPHIGSASRAPLAMVQPFSLIGAPLGLARAATSLFETALKDSAPEQDLFGLGATAARLASASAEVDAAMALVLADSAFIDQADDPAVFTPMVRAKARRDCAYAAQKCRYAVTSLFEASGGRGIYDASAIQRLWRDVNSACAHAAFNWDAAAAQLGRVLVDGSVPGGD